MREDGEPIKIICNGKDITSTHDIIVHSRINNCGTKFNTSESQRTLSPLDRQIECHCLSVTNSRWIGRTIGASYIVELVKKSYKNVLKCCGECNSVRLEQLPKPYETIYQCKDCTHPNLFE